MLEKYKNILQEFDPVRFFGKVIRVEGSKIETLGPPSKIGELCHIYIQQDSEYKSIPVEVIGFHDERKLYVMPYHPINGIEPGCEIRSTERVLGVDVSMEMKGRVLNGLGLPQDKKSPFVAEEYRHIFQSPPDPLHRKPIESIMETGVRAIDGLLSIGEGQRIGIFAGSGVGKSSLLGMIARNIKADVNVIALIGERGREVRNFIENDLGAEGFKNSVLVVATSDTSPLMRVRAGYTATTIAEYFRDKGLRVNLMMDSITRFARAQREIGLASGEFPTANGYTPSVFSSIPEILERAGQSDKGSITAFYSVLVEGDDFSEPITDLVRGILDGHIYLDRRLANQVHYPAIDIVQSISRVAPQIMDGIHLREAEIFKRIYSAYREIESLVQIGAYQTGSNPYVDEAKNRWDKIEGFLQQRIDEYSSLDETKVRLSQILKGIKIR